MSFFENHPYLHQTPSSLSTSIEMVANLIYLARHSPITDDLHDEYLDCAAQILVDLIEHPALLN